MSDQPNFTPPHIPDPDKQAIINDYVQRIAEQREEILEACFAKYGTDRADLLVQVHKDNSWRVVKTTDEEQDQVKAEIVRSLAARKLVSLMRTLIENIERKSFPDGSVGPFTTYTATEYTLNPAAIEALGKLKNEFSIEDTSQDQISAS